jgi:hypothetical protein
MQSRPRLDPRRTRAWLSCVALALLPVACSDGCDGGSPAPAPVTSPNAQSQTAPGPARDAGASQVVGASQEAPDGGAAGAEIGEVPPHAGPFFTVTTGSSGIYADASPDRSRKLGYARNGGRVPVLAGTVPGEGCRGGWYRLLDGGYICGSEGSINPDDPQVRLAVRAPDLGAALPYPYARNAQNGTPLYASVPSRDQMVLYEPYLEPNDAPRSGAADDEGSLAWWQRKEAQLNDVRLAELTVESDGVLGRRMVKGFYVAVDTQFEWLSRSWYKTTKGMVAPKDRFVAVEASDFKGVDLDAEHSLPVAWVYGFRQDRPTYLINEDGKPKQNGQVARLVPIHLTGEKRDADGHTFLQSKAGFWVRGDHVRVAAPPPVPVNVQENEHWIHVDLYSQTLVALAGSTPVYATLVSSGKEAEDEDKDHRTPPGEWNIREKHVTTTMDGDGTAAGDLPYSIEDVPYVMYFQGSYALHGAFWHRNYGVRMSHGCINLAPLDARYLFFFTGPSVREGWHGAWSGNGQAGSRVVIDGPRREASARR